MIIDFIVLACSHKHHERCVAGIDATNHKLIRLVSRDSSTNYAIPTSECKIDKRNLVPLDRINVELTAHMDKLGAQTENYVVSFPLVKKYIGKASIDNLNPYLYECKTSLFPFPFGSRDPYMRREKYYYEKESLCLIPAYKLYFSTIKKNDKYKTKVTFNVYKKYGNEQTTLSEYAVTDPMYMFYDGISNNAGKKALGKAYILISLGQDDDSDYYYKYVSGIIDFSGQTAKQQSQKSIEDLF